MAMDGYCELYETERRYMVTPNDNLGSRSPLATTIPDQSRGAIDQAMNIYERSAQMGIRLLGSDKMAGSLDKASSTAEPSTLPSGLLNAVSSDLFEVNKILGRVTDVLATLEKEV